jgi:hypothetical protein
LIASWPVFETFLPIPSKKAIVIVLSLLSADTFTVAQARVFFNRFRRRRRFWMHNRGAAAHTITGHDKYFDFSSFGVR